MKRVSGPFRRLQWKLTFSYTLITIAALLLVELIAAIFVFQVTSASGTQLFPDLMLEKSLQASTYFLHGSLDREGLSAWLAGPDLVFSTFVDAKHGYIAVVDTQGNIIAAKGNGVPAPGMSIRTSLSTAAVTNLDQALMGKTGLKVLTSQEAGGYSVLVMPVLGRDQSVRAVLVVYAVNVLDGQRLLMGLLPVVLTILIAFTVCAGLAGTLFGFLTARGFTRRFKRLSNAADNWSHGDFTAFAQDTSGDELGQLTRQLNRMAEQLQNLLQTRQELASLEERNRLARDLHDSVKQQVFAVSMQISTAKALLKRDVGAAEGRIGEAERLVRQVQQELTSLIRELRPVVLEGKGLVLALQELVRDWSRQSGIAADVQIGALPELALTEQEALYRVAQEGLANVARHSQASAVQVQLTSENSTVILRLSDNGTGFDVAARNGQGVGLLSMRERMKALNGDVEIESVAGKGTVIEARCHHVSITV